MTTINANDGEIIIKGTKNYILMIKGNDKQKIKELLSMLRLPPAMGGTYYPKPYSLQGAYSCLCRMYYVPGKTQVIPIKVDGDLPDIPYPGGPDAVY